MTRPSLEWLDEQQAWLASLIVTHYTNEQGVLSRDYPPSSATLFADLDDFVPYLIEAGHQDFCVTQANHAVSASVDGLLASGGRVVSWRQDEYAGGLIECARATGDRTFLDAALAVNSGLRRHLVREGFLAGYWRVGATRCSAFASPRSLAVCEVFIELDSLDDESRGRHIEFVRSWTELPATREFGLVASFHHLSGRWVDHISQGCPFARPTIHRRFVWDALRALPFAMQLELTKDNYSYAFALLAIIRRTGDSWAAEALTRWVAGLRRLLLHDGQLHSAIMPGRMRRGPVLFTHVFAAIDLLVEASFHLPESCKCLALAEEIAKSILSVQLENGLVPTHHASNVDWLDTQTDLCVALLKLGEATGKDRYYASAWAIEHAVFELHRTQYGLVNTVDLSGAVPQPGVVSPKFNALALKGLMAWRGVLREKSLIHDHRLRELTKDR